MTTQLTTDYLIIGCGAVGMAFADVILSETEANIIIVDKHHKPGGHWNDAYSFVTLHQPSAFYGVSSLELSKGTLSKSGTNKGLNELATGAEIMAYFDEVMRERFLPSGRVQYFPMCEYLGDGRFKSLLADKHYQVTVNNKTVDATYFQTSVPSTHTPNFSIAPEVDLRPLNDLPKLTRPRDSYVVVGGGKTGIDACLWLLENQINPNNITWIMPRDAWLINRLTTQPGREFFKQSIGNQANQLEAMVAAESIDDLFARLEKAESLLRIDTKIKPEMFHGATISLAELEQMRHIKNVVRLGRVTHIDTNKMVFEQGKLASDSGNTLYIDCSASAVPELQTLPVFTDDSITIQTVRSFQPVFSGGFIAHIEATYQDNKKKNQLCTVVPLPNHATDWIRNMAGQMMNQYFWSQEDGLRSWLLENRLDAFTALMQSADPSDPEEMEIIERIKQNAQPAVAKLQQFIAELDAANLTPTLGDYMSEFQTSKTDFSQTRIVEAPTPTLADGDILLAVERFAFTANNITYAVMGEQIRYWQFFPTHDDAEQQWGIIPVWGFAKVVESKHDAVPVGERLFGYFPPATALKITPVNISEDTFFDGSLHRADLPPGYNVYRRVAAEPGYNPANDPYRMLLWPLHVTSFCIHDMLQEDNWHDAEQVLVISASSKTSIGVGYALAADDSAPNSVGITSARNLQMVEDLGLYDSVTSYDDMQSIDNTKPTVIVDMSANGEVLSKLHTHLGDNMRFCLNVGATHWGNVGMGDGFIAARSKQFFAPDRIQKRMKDWGPEGFNQRTAQFIQHTATQSSRWLKIKPLNGLQGLADIYSSVLEGTAAADEGLIVEIVKA